MRTLLLVAVLAATAQPGGCGSKSAPYKPCAGKACGDSCTLCAPNATDCAETANLKACTADGECASAGLWCINGPTNCVPVPVCGANLPCSGKKCGDTCTCAHRTIQRASRMPSRRHVPSMGPACPRGPTAQLALTVRVRPCRIAASCQATRCWVAVPYREPRARTRFVERLDSPGSHDFYEIERATARRAGRRSPGPGSSRATARPLGACDECGAQTGRHRFERHRRVGSPSAWREKQCKRLAQR